MRRLCLLTSLCMLLSACELSPTYRTPPTSTPAAFKEAAEGWAPARPADVQDRGPWWQMFGDTDLNGIEQQVLDANQNLKAAAARLQQARALAKNARADLYPTLNAGASETSGKLSRAVSNPLPNRAYDDEILGLDASYEIDLWGRIRDTARAARDEAQASAGDLESARLSLQAEAAVDYLTLRSFDAEAVVLDDTVAAFTSALELTRSRFDAGYAAEPDVAAAESALNLARTKAADARLNRAKLEHALAILTGQPPAAFSLTVRLIEGDPPEVAGTLPGELLERRPDIAAAERRVEAANYRIGAARAAFFPTFSLSGVVGTEGRVPSALFTDPASVWSAGAAGVLNLFDGGRRRAVDAQANAERDEATARYRQIVLTACGEVEDNLAALRWLADENQTQAAAVAAAEVSRAQAERRYSAGYASYYDVITAQNIELSAKLDQVQIRFRRMNADVLLIKALGGGWRADELTSWTVAKSP